MMNDEKITFIPAKNSHANRALNDGTSLTNHGWLDIPSDGLGLWRISNWHSFDDMGATLETLTVQRLGVTKEVYSYDDGETFTILPPACE